MGLGCVNAAKYIILINDGEIYYRNSSLLPNNPYVTVQEFSTSNPLVLSVSDTNPVDSRKIHVLTVNGVECYVNITAKLNGMIKIEIIPSTVVIKDNISAPWVNLNSIYLYKNGKYVDKLSPTALTPYENKFSETTYLLSENNEDSDSINSIGMIALGLIFLILIGYFMIRFREKIV